MQYSLHCPVSNKQLHFSYHVIPAGFAATSFPRPCGSSADGAAAGKDSPSVSYSTWRLSYQKNTIAGDDFLRRRRRNHRCGRDKHVFRPKSRVFLSERALIRFFAFQGYTSPSPRDIYPRASGIYIPRPRGYISPAIFRPRHRLFDGNAANFHMERKNVLPVIVKSDTISRGIYGIMPANKSGWPEKRESMS